MTRVPPDPLANSAVVLTNPDEDSLANGLSWLRERGLISDSPGVAAREVRS
jgi:hypothetical protein